MKRLALIALVAIGFSSCTTTEYLYNWGKPKDENNYTRYEELAYKFYDRQSPESICELLCLYESLTANPGGVRGEVPPGLCAEYGYLLLQTDTPAIFIQYATSKQKKQFGGVSEYGAFFREKGMEMLNRETTLYPESKTFLTPIIESFNDKQDEED